jgi:hypothetical protein
VQPPPPFVQPGWGGQVTPAQVEVHVTSHPHACEQLTPPLHALLVMHETPSDPVKLPLVISPEHDLFVAHVTKHVVALPHEIGPHAFVPEHVITQ